MVFQRFNQDISGETKEAVWRLHVCIQCLKHATRNQRLNTEVFKEAAERHCVLLHRKDTRVFLIKKKNAKWRTQVVRSCSDQIEWQFQALSQEKLNGNYAWRPDAGPARFWTLVYWCLLTMLRRFECIKLELQLWLQTTWFQQRFLDFSRCF